MSRLIEKSINRLYSNGGQSSVSYEQCDDDLGIFTFDTDSTEVTPSPPVKNADLEFKIVGVVSDDVEVAKVATHVDWEDAPLYDEETKGGFFQDIMEVTLKWNVPAYAPDGNYVNTFKGYTANDQVAWCVTAYLTF